MPAPTVARLAIFDHDGVLVDTLAPHQESWVEVGRRLDLPITPEFVRRTFGMTSPLIFRELCGDRLTAEQIAEYGHLKEAAYREIARDLLVPMPGVAELIATLRGRGFLAAIGSSGPRANLDLTIERCGWSDVFTAIASFEDIQRSKPDPQVFLVAAEKAGVPPSRSVVFEDALVGIRAAKAAGMVAVGVGTTFSLDELHDAGADFAYQTLENVDLDAIETRLAST